MLISRLGVLPYFKNWVYCLRQYTQFFFQPGFLGDGRTRSALGVFQEGLEWIDRGEDGRW
jgi:hypothetical protein